ncbi:MAG TPA: DNA recombination protein RmuC [Beijerinckiaceae bacterium]|jgi:DNA recombination protein RmuC|nr:DNA recombination protein RmuC [Beijerinckiaceae bacterium]
MDGILFSAGGLPVRLAHALFAAVALLLLLLAMATIALIRASRARAQAAEEALRRQREFDERIQELARNGSELAGRVQAFAEAVGSRQADLSRLVSERLDAVGTRVGQGLENQSRTTGDHLAKLNERLAVIDAAQAKLTGLTQEVVGLKDILANKQARGAFGQGRMEAIVKDGLPPSAYEFQYTLTNRNRPDCIIRLPGDERVLVIDAKFPLEAFSALKAADSDELRKQAMSRVRNDIGKHVRDICERYFVPGETQDLAVLFVPSESVYADLAEHFDDLVQKAHNARVIIVSPSLLMMAIQVMQTIVRDARVRDQVHDIQREVQLLVQDVGRLRTRVGKLDGHFRQAQEDVAAITISTEKITRRGDKIEQIDFAREGGDVARLVSPRLAAAE